MLNLHGAKNSSYIKTVENIINFMTKKTTPNPILLKTMVFHKNKFWETDTN